MHALLFSIVLLGLMTSGAAQVDKPRATGVPSVLAKPSPALAESEVRDTLAKFVKAFDNLDWETFRLAFDDNATVFYPRAIPERANGRAQFEKSFKGVFQQIRGDQTMPPYMEIRPKDLKLQVFGNTALATFHLDDRPGFLNRRTIVLSNTRNGWKIVHLHASEVALEAAERSVESVAPSSVSEKNQKPLAADDLVGAWRLITVETIRPNGELIYPFYGKHPEGLLIYDRSGWMSVQIVSDPKPAVPQTDSREGFLTAPPADKVTAVNGYYSYFGTWTVDASASTVTHHIRESLYPGERQETGVRGVTIAGNRLTLTAKTHEMGEDHQRRLVWERIPVVRH